MSYLVSRICKTCGKTFLPKCEKNIFCSRRCFKKDYYYRKKNEKIEDRDKFPTFICPVCEQVIQLDFSPITDFFRWTHYSCPNCNALMINVSEEIITQDKTIV
jgi:predicted RNA-binding Zn-ribbon protein involved in translation (DUF1610 family)